MISTQFIQSSPYFDNPIEDELLIDYLKRHIDLKYQNEVLNNLEKFSKRIVNEIEILATKAENNPPKHIPFSAWGDRIDEIEVDHSWKKLEEIACEEKLISLGYERNQAEDSRLFQMAKIFMFHPSSAFFSCPLAMTDGAAKLIETYGDESLKEKAFKNLTSDNPKNFWTSGQWMTEKTGGSDVGISETIAVKNEDHYVLHGIKWFTSATTSQMAMTLARVVDKNGKKIDGPKGLALFYLELKDENNKLNNLEILRLKDKLGTKALPTAEIRLYGTKAKMIGATGEGIKKISSLFNITRIYNSCCATASYYRLQNLATNYAKNRIAFNKSIISHPLHYKKLTELKAKYQSCFHLTFFLSKLLGSSEINKNDNNEKILRLLTPIAKLYTAKLNLNAASELIESIGGAATIEDTRIPKWLRDAQILTIWEGTTNILSLDAIRAIHKDNALPPFLDLIDSLLIKQKEGYEKSILELKVKEFKNSVNEIFKENNEFIQYKADDLCFTIAKLISALLMLDHANFYHKKGHYLTLTKIFIQQPWPLLNDSTETKELMKLSNTLI